MPVINMPYNPLMLLPLPKVPPNVKRCHPSGNIKTNFFALLANLNKTNVAGGSLGMTDVIFWVIFADNVTK